MTGFFTDLDNTLIFSYKHDIGADKKCVELYEGRKISFATENTLSLIRELNEIITVIPATTRSVEQFRRIDLGVKFKYSLVCNGGVLLADGMRDDSWYQDSLAIVQDSIPEIKKAMDFLEGDSRRYFELRYIENLFLFTKCREPVSVVRDLRMKADNSIVNVFNNGDKVYVVPAGLSKGNALRRLSKKLNLEKTISAGDSDFDISMLNASDLGIIPKDFPEKTDGMSNIHQANGKMIFSDELLEYVKLITENNLAEK